MQPSAADARGKRSNVNEPLILSELFWQQFPSILSEVQKLMQRGESRRTFNVENILSLWFNDLVLKSF